jgi:hypothetical protein
VLPTPWPPEYFTDRSLGRYVVPEALRSLGRIVHTLADEFGAREQTVSDVEWLQLAGERGWVVLAKDRRIRHRPAELELIQAHGLRAFVLPRGGLTGSQQAARFSDNLAEIESACQQPGPFVYSVYQRSIRRLI